MTSHRNLLTLTDHYIFGNIYISGKCLPKCIGEKNGIILQRYNDYELFSYIPLIIGYQVDNKAILNLKKKNNNNDGKNL